MNIGNIELSAPLALAPMAGITDLPFRLICRRLGCGMTVSEMVSAKALCYQDQKTLPLMRLGEDEHPAGVQIFGSDLACMEEGAAIVREVAQPRYHRHQHGLPRPQGRQQRGRLRPAPGPGQACRVAEAVRKEPARSPSP